MQKLIKKTEEFLNREQIWKWGSVFVFLLANILFGYLAFGKTFHYDEAYSIGLSRNSFKDIISITSNDVHSPFYYFLLKVFCMIPGISMYWGAKVFSWIFMCMFMVFGGVVVYRRYGWQVTFFWILLAGFVPSMMIQSTTVRMYTIGLFLVTVASYMAYSIYQKESLKKWIVFTLFGIAAVYIHTFCMLEMVLVYGIFIVVALAKKNFKIVGKALVSGIVVSIAFLPWLFSLWQQFVRWAGWESGWTSSFLPVSLESSTIILSEWFSSMEKPQALAVLFYVVLLIYAGYHVRDYVKEKKDYLPCVAMILLGLLLVVATIVSNYVVPCFLGRYALPLFGGVWLFVAIGLSRTNSNIRKAIIALVILYLGLAAFREEVRLENDEGLQAFQQYVETHVDLAEDVIMADRYFNAMFSIFYEDAEYMVFGSKPTGLPFKNVGVFTDWEQLEGVDTVWFISFADNPGAGLSPEVFEAVESFHFDYSYYHIKVEKMVRK